MFYIELLQKWLFLVFQESNNSCSQARKEARMLRKMSECFWLNLDFVSVELKVDE